MVGSKEGRTGQYRRDRSSPLKVVLWLAVVTALLEGAFLWGIRPRTARVRSNLFPVSSADPSPERFSLVARARWILEEERDPREALDLARTALLAGGPDAEVHAVLGEAHMRLGHKADARHHLSAATYSEGDEQSKSRARSLLETLNAPQ